MIKTKQISSSWPSSHQMVVSPHTAAPQLTKLVVVEEFCKIALEFIRKGLSFFLDVFLSLWSRIIGSGNKSMFKAASEKLGVTPDVVEHAVDGLGHLFTEVCSGSFAYLNLIIITFVGISSSFEWNWFSRLVDCSCISRGAQHQTERRMISVSLLLSLRIWTILIITYKHIIT